jgi:DNA-binding CsgD family transcriptional regulator
MTQSTKAPSGRNNQRFANGKIAEFSASGKYRRRGRRNRFATDASRETEPDRIIEMMTAGLSVSDIADAMKLSVATIYRRITGIRKLMSGQPASVRASQEKRAVALLALLQANTARAHAVAEERMAKIRGTSCCPACEKAALEIAVLQRANETHKVEIDFLKHMGFFDWVRKSGRAFEILEMARNQGKPRPKTAANAGTCEVV